MVKDAWVVQAWNHRSTKADWAARAREDHNLTVSGLMEANIMILVKLIFSFGERQLCHLTSLMALS